MNSRTCPKRRVSQPVSGTEMALATANEVITQVPCVGRDAEVAGDRRDRHVGDRRVEHVHEGRERQRHGAERELCAVQRRQRRARTRRRWRGAAPAPGLAAISPAMSPPGHRSEVASARTPQRALASSPAEGAPPAALAAARAAAAALAAMMRRDARVGVRVAACRTRPVDQPAGGARELRQPRAAPVAHVDVGVHRQADLQRMRGELRPGRARCAPARAARP